MQSSSSITNTGIQEQVKSFRAKTWEELNDQQKIMVKRAWGLLTYKWQWQIALNAPFMIIWILDRLVPSVHKYNMELLKALELPNWLYSWLGF